MTMPRNSSDREFTKFIEDLNGDTAQRVVITGGNTPGLSTAAKQDALKAAFDAFAAAASTAALQSTGNSSLASIFSAMATAAKQDTGNASAASIDGKLSLQATAAKQDALKAAFDALADLVSTSAKQDTLRTDANTNAASAHADALQLDNDLLAFKAAAHADALTTQTKQDTGNASAASIDGKVSTSAKQDALKAAFDAFVLIASTAAKQDTLDADINAFKSANHTDLLAVQTKQDTGNTSLASILAAVSTAARQDLSKAVLDAILTALSNRTQKSILTDGTSDAVFSNVNGTKALQIEVIRTVSALGSGVSQSDNTAVTLNSTAFTPTGALFNDSAPDLISGNGAYARMTKQRGIHFNPRDSSGVEILQATAPNQVTGNNTLSGISVKLPASLGTKTAAASLSVTPSTDGLFYTNDPDTLVSSTITTADLVVAAPLGTGVLTSGASTAGSIVAAAAPGGDASWTVAITGGVSGSYYFEASLDSTNGTDGNWTNVNGRQTGVVNTVLSGKATVGGIYRGNTAGIAWLRVRNVGGTGVLSTAVRIRISAGTGAVFLNASIPAGTNVIGGVTDYDTESGNYSRIDGTGKLRTTDTIRLIGGGQESNLLDARVWSSSTASGGAITNGGSGISTISPGTTSGGTASIVTLAKARFINATINNYFAGVRVDQITQVGNTRRWGVFNATDGLFFELIDGVIGVTVRNSSVDTRSTAFNGTTAFVLDTSFHVYEINYSAGTARFYQDGKLIHKFTTATDSVCDTMSLPAAYQTINTAAASASASIYARGTAVSRFGNILQRSRYFNGSAAATTVLKSAAGTLRKVVLNKRGAAGATLNIYDNTAGSGTLIGIVDTTAGGPSFEYDLDFSIGLTIVSAGVVGDFTVIYD